MSTTQHRFASAVLPLLCLLTLLPPRAAAQELPNPCPDELETLRPEIEAQDDATAVQWLAGCYLAREDFDAAQALLERATALEPESEGILLDLTVVHFHSDRIAEAKALIDGFSEVFSRDAEVELYRGLVLQRLGEHKDAVAALERARRRDPQGVEPVASYYAATSWEALGEEERAREALSRVSDDWPGTPWSLQAEQRRLRMEGRYPRSFWLSAKLALERDNNVVLRGRGVALPDEISNQRDGRGEFEFRASSELIEFAGWRGGAGVAYEGNAHFDLDRFDLQSPSFVVWIDRPLRERVNLRFQYDFAHAWLDGDSFATSHRAAAIVRRDWRRVGTTELSVEGVFLDFAFANRDVLDGPGGPGSSCTDPAVICGPAGLDEGEERDRDGAGLRFELAQGIDLPKRFGDLRFGYLFESYHSEGNEYRFVGNGALLEIGVDLPLALRSELHGRYQHRAYRHPTSFAEPDVLAQGLQYPLRGRDRRENEFEIGIRLERPLLGNWKLGASYTYRRNRSSASVFDTRQQIVGAFLRWNFSGRWP